MNPKVEIGNSIVGATKPNALDDTNLDDIDDDDNAERPAVAIGPPEMIRVLSGLDDRLAEALRAGDIKLLRVLWLRRLRRLPDWGTSLRRRQAAALHCSQDQHDGVQTTSRRAPTRCFHIVSTSLLPHCFQPATALLSH